MKAYAILLCALAATLTSGCISLKRKNFTLELPAAELNVIAKTELSPEEIRRSIGSTAPPVQQTTSTSLSAEHSNGPDAADGQGSVMIDRVVITSSGRKLPRQAPNLSSAQTASLICSALVYRFPDTRARRAHEATLEASRMRKAADRGEIDERRADRSELERQDAVRAALSAPIPVLDLIFNNITRKSDLPAPRSGPLAISELGLIRAEENGREVFIITGDVRNTGDQDEELPPLTLVALDEWEFVVSGQSALLPLERLGARQSVPFRLRFLNPPDTAYEIAAHFAPPFRYYGNNRLCDFLDPGLSDALTSLESKADAATTSNAISALLKPVLAAAEGRETLSLNERLSEFLDPYQLRSISGDPAAPYTVAELNALTQHFRSRASREWLCRTRETPNCLGSSRRLTWRDAFALGETANEAWIAMSARTAMERSVATGGGQPVDIEISKLAEDQALEALQRSGEAALARAGRPPDDITILSRSASLSQENRGLFLDISGEAMTSRPGGATTREVLIALVDRRGLPLASLLAPVDLNLQPGVTTPFRVRVRADRETGPNSQKSEDDPGLLYIGRLPSERIAWEVRIAAIAGLNPQAQEPRRD